MCAEIIMSVPDDWDESKELVVYHDEKRGTASDSGAMASSMGASVIGPLPPTDPLAITI